MSYSGNMPDWHQYNPPQHGRATTTSGGQNVNSNHLFLSSINPPTLDTINLTTTDRQTKHQRNDVNYTGRNYPQAGTMANSSSGVHMAPLSSCVSHYGTSPSRNPMMEGMSGTMDPRLGTVGSLTDTELPHRTTQMPFNAPTNHANASNMSGIHGGMTSQTSPVGPMSPSRQAPYGACKGPCCNPDASIAYQHWEKYGHYQANAAYRDNMRTSGYPIDNRRYVPDMNLRKDCHENKELVAPGFGVDNRRNYTDYKYRKELSRNYPASGLLQNYPMQHYNFPSDCQKCPYSVKDYLRRGSTTGSSMNSQNPGIIKYPEQQSVIVQQKYNGKQLSYQNGALSSGIPNTSSANLSSSLQNSYFNAQLPRDVPRDFSREYQDPGTVSSRLPTSPSSAVQGSYQKYHVYQQKIAMQRYSIENHLRAMTRMPGYQSHPKYQEYLMRYRELVRLQQNVDYQGVLQDTAKIPSPPSAPIQPINLQFDQNGVLVNSTYNPGHFPAMHNPANPTNPNPENTENLETNQANVNNASIDPRNHYLKHSDQTLNLSRNVRNIHHTNQENPNRYLMQKSDNNSTEQFENLIVDVDELDVCRAITSATETMPTTTMSMMEGVKTFSNKPELDVRQFLANWDETEEEEALAASLPKDVANNSTSVIVADCSLKRETTTQEKPPEPQRPEESVQKEKPAEATPVAEASAIVQDDVENIDVTGLTTIEELANSGTIVQCIQSDTDDIPTIHIVDHLSEESELATIQTVYGDVTSLTIEEIAKAPIEIISETPEGTETITLFEADSGVCTKIPECNDAEESEVDNAIVVQDVIASVIDTSVEITNAPEASNEVANQAEKGSELTFDKSSTQPVKRTEENVAQGLDLTSKSHQTVGDNLNLRKQHSFASEESHNPDDISLPDIPMSECTPISTTLNTPIHSDSEESSEHGAALEISTNPIEIVRNSPIISFTHSPIKIDPYGNLENDRLSEKRPHDSLDFDFHQDDNPKTKFDEVNKNTAVEDFEIARRSSTESVAGSSDTQTEEQHKEPLINTTMEENSSDKDQEFYPSSDPLVGMVQTPKMMSNNENQENSPAIADISNDIIQNGDCSVETLGGNTRPGTPVSRILSPDEIDTGKCPSIIDTEDFQPSDDLDKLCNISLDDSCMMPLITGDNSRESRMPITSIEDHSLTKVMKDIGPISEMDVLESSDDEQLDKDDDAWVEVRSLDDELLADLSANEMVNRSQNCSTKSPNNQRLHSNELDNNFDSSEDVEKTTNYHKTVTNWSEYPKFKHNPKSDNYFTESTDERVHETKTNYIPSIFDISGDSKSTEFDKFERRKKEKNNKDLLKSLREYRKDKSKDRSERFERDNAGGQSQDSQDSVSQVSGDLTLVKSIPIELRTRISREDNVEERIVIKKRVEESQNLQDEKSFIIKSDALRPLESCEMRTVTQSFRRTHKDTDVQIQVANINVNEKSDDDASDAVGAIEIKINVSRSDKNRRKYSQEKLVEEVAEVIRKRAFITSDLSNQSPGRISNQRRLSVPEELESRRPKKINKDGRRRHSGGHSFKSHHRRSVEERSTKDHDDRSRQFDITSRNSELPTVSEREVTDKEDVDQSNFNEWPLSSQENSQDSDNHEDISRSVFNDAQEGTNDETALEDYHSKMKEPKRRITLEQSEPISRSNLDELEHIVSRSSFEMTPGPSHVNLNDNPWNKTNFHVENTSTLDFDNFDVAPNEGSDTDLPRRDDEDEMHSRMDEGMKSRRLEDSEKYRNPYAMSKPPGVEALEINLNTVPIYTTKDGKITYSPNPRYTYRALIMEARQREGYPALRDLYYSKSSRDSQDKRLYKHRNESFEREKRRWSEYNAKRMNQPLSRRRMEDPGRRVSRAGNKYESRWRERPLETEEFTDDRSRIYSDTSVPPSYCSTDSAFKTQHHRYYQAIQSSRRVERYHQEDVAIQRRKNDANLDGECAIESVMDGSLTNQSYGLESEALDCTKCVETRIFNGQEMELFSMNADTESKATIEPAERVSRPEEKVSPVKQNLNAIVNENETSKTQIKWTVPHGLDPPLSDDESKYISRNSMKPPASVDVEQDSEAMLTDSGLESSTTYTEGSKEPKRCQTWQRTFLDHSEKVQTAVKSDVRTPESIFEEPKSPEQIEETKKDDIFYDSQINLEVTEKIDLPEVNPDHEVTKVGPINNQDNNDEEKRPMEVEKKEERLFTEKETPKIVPDISTLTKLFLSTDHMKNLDSSTLKGLDLAFPTRHNTTKGPPQLQPPRINVERVEEEANERSQEEKSRPASIFNRQDSLFLGIKRIADTPVRRASSDGVDSSRKQQSTFYEDISSATSLSIARTNTLMSIAGKSTPDKHVQLEESRETTKPVEETQSTDVSRVDTASRLREESSQSDDEKFEKPEVPSRFIHFRSFNNPAQKANEETCDVSTESEVSHYDDTLSSTQFGSECADSKTDDSSTVGVTFLSTSSQEAIDATDLNQVQKNLALCVLNDVTATKETSFQATEASSKPTERIIEVEDTGTENKDKILSFSGRISSESEDDSNAQHGSPIRRDDETEDLSIRTEKHKDKILSFSGQIQSPESRIDAQNSSPIRSEEQLTEKNEDSGKLLTFSGRIPSPESRSENLSPKQIDVKREILSSNFLSKNIEQNLTFSGKIQSELGEPLCKSPQEMDKIPKFIIKKTDGASRSSSISQIFPSDQGSQKSSETKASSNHKISLHPKIPKMIIRNVKSRPGTPTVEESAVELSFPKSHEGEQKVFEVKIKLDDKTVKHDGGEGSVKKSIGVIECKIPKMKIKLEDKVPKMIFKNASMKLFDKDSSESSKNVPKVKIRKIKRSSSREEKSSNKIPKKSESTSDKSERSTKTEKTKESSSKSTESSHKVDTNRDDSKPEKIPKLKIKKQDTKSSSPSPEPWKKKRSKSPAENAHKNQKKSSSRHKSSEAQFVDSEGNTNSQQSASEKIPKVIIKRASASAEFKCELSKDGGDAIIRNSKWQPEVKLQRFKVLDSIAKEPGRVKLPPKMLDMITREKEKTEAFKCLRRSQWTRAVSDPTERREHKSDRSLNKGKRRYSDPERPRKSQKTSHDGEKLVQKKSSSVRSLDNDSDSEIFPRLIKSCVSRRLHEESSQDESLDTKSSAFTIPFKINEEKVAVRATSRQCSSQEPQTDVTRSEFEYISTSSSHKKINSPTKEPIIPATENADIVIVDVKSHNNENLDEPESVIKLESSDESQTTIEILPASPDLSQPESEVPIPLEGKRRIANGDMAQLYSEDAIPTQFELELEIVDNSSESSEVPVPSCAETINENRCLITYSGPKRHGEKRDAWQYQPSAFPDDSKACSTSDASPGPSFVRRAHEDDRQMKNICCSDSLVKEVLAAKETLKRCLAKSKNESISKVNLALRPKTAAEKKQGAAFGLVGISSEKGESSSVLEKDHRVVFQESCAASSEASRRDHSKPGSERSVRKYSRSERSSSSTERQEKRSKTSSEVRRRDKSPSVCDPSSQGDSLSSRHSSIKSLKRPREPSESRDHSSHTSKKMRPPSAFSSTSQCTDSSRSKASASFDRKQGCVGSSRDSQHQSYKIPKISRSQESRTRIAEVKPKLVEVMPILEPEGHFDPSERDTSRSPPVITKQESNEMSSDSPKKVEEKDNEKIETIIHQEAEAVTFADIVAQMAYHEKATIKHRRYCILCERWFPTTERHRRHLVGYQHRHTELTQRRTIHALFMLFTGKPCSRLLPASIVRTDYVPGEPTPLQIAVQDVAISLEKGDKKKTVNEEDK